MKTEKLNEILKLVEHKVNMDTNGTSWITPSVMSAINWLVDEIDEAKEEYIEKKQVYLEDELCDVVWSIFRMIEIMDRENSVNKSRIFDRVIKKYSERIWWLEQWKKWNDIKKIQKAELLEEQTNLENN